ncbi:MAG: DUF2085 domain-containing protein [Clostridia bacterium]|nr:DUF2085 domain-containing protein [Clostridia bacterium]
MSVGKMSGCHQLPKRSFFFGKYQFPICARCTGIVVGYIVGLALSFFLIIPLEISVVLMAVMFIDWFLQYEKVLKSTNIRRLFTGIGCGTGYFHILIYIAKIIFGFVGSL